MIEPTDTTERIAVIGIAGRFPQAKDVDLFWQNLRDGMESIRRFTDEDLKAHGVSPAALNDPSYVKAGAHLDNIEMFDALFFGYSPNEAAVIDPQQRIFLESAAAALENAGYDPSTYSGLIGVYAGAGMNDYMFNVYSSRDPNDVAGEYQKMISNDKDFLATRVSYKLGLRGPSMTVQTACSTSLVAVQTACQSLLNYQSDIALAGGVSIRVPQTKGYFHQEGMILSPDGHCRAFDAKAQGTVGGEGVGVVVLKRLSEALEDNDTILAVIIGSAINNDGAMKVGFTAPSIQGQAEAILSAHSLEQIDPESITYIEAHGTGTQLGDPIEVAALTQAFRAGTDRKGYCAIGSVKTNIGHLDAAAGVTGMIKTILALKHKQIPPSLHFERPNPNIDFENSPFYVNTKLTAWESNGNPRRAGVSSFGIGGTNAHVLLEEAPAAEPSGDSRPRQLLVLSAMTESALDAATDNLVEHLKQHPETNLADAAYTLQVGRRALRHRRIVVVENSQDAIDALAPQDSQRVFTSSEKAQQKEVVFMFPGQGSQYVNMGLELYHTEPLYREHVGQCCEVLKPHMGFDLRDVLFADESRADEAAERLKNTAVTQPALFVVEYALAKLWMSWGVQPAAVVGHSIGEYVAACLAGVFSVEDALSLVATRGQLIQDLPSGSMLAVPLSEQEVLPLLNQQLSLAAINSPQLCVVSGEEPAILELEKQLSQKDIRCQHLHTSHAFHSHMVEPILETFAAALKKVSLQPPQIPLVSTVTGTWVGPKEISQPAYWTNNLRQTVRFADGMQAILTETDRILLEVGPGQTLSTLARQHPSRDKRHVVLSSLRHPKEQKSDLGFVLTTLGRLWLAGLTINWAQFYATESRRRIPLPTYPFERQRCWIDSPKPTDGTNKPSSADRKHADVADWFYLPTWRREPAKRFRSGGLAGAKLNWLVFTDTSGLGAQLAARLEQEDQQVTTVSVGRGFSKRADRAYTINPRNRQDYTELCGALAQVPDRVVHLWSLTPERRKEKEHGLFDETQVVGFCSLVFLTQALAGKNHPIRITAISNGLYEVTGDEKLSPSKATLLGPCKTIPQEHANIHCSSIDIVLPRRGADHEHQILDYLLATLSEPAAPPQVAFRRNHRWVPHFERLELADYHVAQPKLKQKGVYLITGGLGTIGLRLADYLARTTQARLVLLGRSQIPDKPDWQGWLESHEDQDKVSIKIRKLQALEELGAEVMPLSADVADQRQMRRAVAQAIKRFGALNGVIHAAGILGDDLLRPIDDIDREHAQRHFHAKAHGLITLEKVLRDIPLDFCLLTSSLSSVLGGVGYASYAAGNLFMDAFAYRMQRSSATCWKSINWDAWQDDVRQAPGRTGDNQLTRLAMSPQEGVETFECALALDDSLTQVVVSTADLSARLAQWVDGDPAPKSQNNAEDQVSNSAQRKAPRAAAGVAPQGNVERMLASIWSDLLGIEKVDVHDDFFDLGGSSLIALRLFSQIESAYGKRLPLTTLFEAPTIHQLAPLVGEPFESAPEWSSLVSIQPEGDNPPFFAMHAAGGNVLIYRDLARHLGLDQPFYGLQARGLDGKAPIATSIESMAEIYVRDIQSVQPHGPYLLGGYCMGGTIALEVAQKLRAGGHEVALLALLETYNWASSRLVRKTSFDDVYFYTQKVEFHLRNFFWLNSRQKSTFLSEKLKAVKDRSKVWYGTLQSKLGGRLPDADRRNLLLAEIWANNDRAAVLYQPRVYPGKITHYRPTNEYVIYQGPELEANGGVDIRRLPVCPAAMLVEPFAEQLAAQLKQDIGHALDRESQLIHGA